MLTKEQKEQLVACLRIAEQGITLRLAFFANLFGSVPVIKPEENVQVLELQVALIAIMESIGWIEGLKEVESESVQS